MKRVFKKYFVVSLSLMLILSNFSFATQLMFCEMTDDSSKCECSHKEKPVYPGISLTQEKNKCCDEKTTELTNSNTLLNYNNIQENDSYANIALFCVSTIDPGILNNVTFRYFPPGAYHPQTDIPVFTSSLLI